MSAFTVDEVGAASLFLMARGRGGENDIQDRDALVALLREFANQGVRVGLEKSKALFQDSTDARGGCKIYSQGDECKCFLCAVDEELFRIGGSDMTNMPKRFLVYVEQVDQTYVEVWAKNEAEAREIGYAKWRREEAHSRVMSVEEIGEEPKEPQ